MNSINGSYEKSLPENGKGLYETKEISAAEVDRQRSRIRWRLILKEFAKVYVISLAVFIVIASAGFIGIQSILGKIEYATEEDMVIPEDLDNLYVKPEAAEEQDLSVVFTEEDMLASEEQLSRVSAEEGALPDDEAVTNILLLGTDGRSPSAKQTRSDVIIILSINRNTKKLIMTSVMRDTYVHIPGRTENEKITHAHVYGGPALTMQTIEENLGIKLDHFASTNFYGFMDVVDALGGVDVPVYDNQYKVINTYIAEVNKILGLPSSDGFLSETGDSVHLTGKQAMGFVRNRYIENGDFARADHQRMVLEQLIAKAREADYRMLIDTADAVASNLYTDLTSQEILSLAMEAIEYKDYELVQRRVPDDSTESIGGNYKGHWVLRIDLEANRELLHEAIYG